MKVYTSGFTADHIYRNELKIIANLQLKGMSKQEIKDKVFEDNLFQCRSEAAIKDMFPRVFRRSEKVDDTLRRILVNGSRSDNNAILLYAFLMNFKFPRDFLLEVIHYNLKRFKNTVTEGNFQTFIDEKGQQYEEVRSWTENTKYKLKQVTLKILVEVELLVKNGKEFEIKQIPLSKELRDYAEQNPRYRDLIILTLND